MTNPAMRSPFSAAAIADWFVERVSDEAEQDLSNLKLQKLVYLAHSLYLSRFHIPLIEDEVQAWENGPAIKPLYGIYKQYGNNPIRRTRLGIPRRAWPTEVDETLADIWTSFAGYSAWKLREITHEAGPWKNHWQAGSRNVIIPMDEIRDGWHEFERYAETPIVARANNTRNALERYRRVLNDSAVHERTGDLQLLLEDSNETEHMRRRASSLFA